MSNDNPMDNRADPVEPVTRQAFLRQGLAQLMAHCIDPLFSWTAAHPAVGGPTLRPPGALPNQAFVTTCQPFCSECCDACPRDAIFQDTDGFPVIQPETAPCVMCTDVPCTQVCPTGALSVLDDASQIRMGTAVIELTVCTAYQGSGCTVCHSVCPLIEAAITLTEGLPQIMPEQCTGCGVCIYECPTPGAIQVVPMAPASHE